MAGIVVENRGCERDNSSQDASLKMHSTRGRLQTDRATAFEGARVTRNTIVFLICDAPPQHAQSYNRPLPFTPLPPSCSQTSLDRQDGCAPRAEPYTRPVVLRWSHDGNRRAAKTPKNTERLPHQVQGHFARGVKGRHHRVAEPAVALQHVDEKAPRSRRQGRNEQVKAGQGIWYDSGGHRHPPKLIRRNGCPQGSDLWAYKRRGRDAHREDEPTTTTAQVFATETHAPVTHESAHP